MHILRATGTSLHTRTEAFHIRHAHMTRTLICTDAVGSIFCAVRSTYSIFMPAPHAHRSCIHVRAECRILSHRINEDRIKKQTVAVESQLMDVQLFPVQIPKQNQTECWRLHTIRKFHMWTSNKSIKTRTFEQFANCFDFTFSNNEISEPYSIAHASPRCWFCSRCTRHIA